MDIQEFRRELLQDAALYAAVERDFASKAYIHCVVKDLIECEECTDYTPCYFEGVDKKGRKIEIYGYNYDEDDHTLSIFSCHYSGGESPEVLAKADLMKIFEKAKAFVAGSFAGTLQRVTEESGEAFEFANYLQSIKDQIERYKFYIVTDAEKSERIKTLDVEPIEGKPAFIGLWDITNFFDLKISKRGYDDIEINFADFGFQGIPCLKASETIAGNEYEAYLCVMPGILLAKLYEKYGGRLLEANVRSYLKSTTRTNKGIRATILTEPHMFFAYNNGITTTATNVKVEDSPEGRFLSGVTSLQIVNGGQTTVTIFNVRQSKDNPDFSSIFVPMKISVVSPLSAEKIVPNISRFANTQNKVSEADFFSNHPFHVKMEKISRKILVTPRGGSVHGTRWYYERARGQYQQEQAGLSRADKEKFLRENPNSQKFNKTDLAKFWNSWEKSPHIVSKHATDSFRLFAGNISAAWEATPERFNEAYFKESVALAILFKATDGLVASQSWYGRGYKAQIVTYSVAKLADMIDGTCGWKLNLQKIWDDQALDDVLIQQMIKITEQIYYAITAPNTSVQDVAQYCKRQECWQRVKGLDIKLDAAMSRCLISEGRARTQVRTAAGGERQTGRMMANIEMVNLGSQYWRDAYEWGVEHDLLDFDEKQDLKSAFNIENRRPSERQSERIITARNKLRENGWKK